MTEYARRSIVDRMKGAAMLDVATYEEVENDLNATGQAAIVVVITALAAGIGSFFHGGVGIIGAIIGSLVGWAVGAWLAFMVGTRVFGGTATWGELLRTLGFAQSPKLLMILAIIPGIGPLIALVLGIWVAVAEFVALRQALDLDGVKTFFTVLICIIPAILIGSLLAMLGIPMR